MPRTISILLVASLLAPSLCLGENRFFFGPALALTGSGDNSIEVLCDNDETALGFSYAIRYDPAAIEVTSLTNEDTAAATADYFSGRIEQLNGSIGFGCVFDVGGTFDEKRLPAGTSQRIGRIGFSVLAEESVETILRFDRIAFAPNERAPVRNVLTDENGQSVIPALEEGSITIITAAPVISAITGGEGEAGQVFQVTGTHLDQPGLSVEVCGTEAEHSLREDGQTIDVTAPDCETAGCVAVRVITSRGSAGVADGFCYPPEKNSPRFLRGDVNSDQSIELTDAIFTLNYLFVGGRLPTCLDAADVNDNASVELTDAIFILNYLFIGGRLPAAPFPACGQDTTADEIDCATPPNCP
ncbi:MAG: dockerin type I repeat-containing protein [Planctomycetota bacterium]|nr:dockerin type I repeat-containing protein [Planctomycetota bacterium]